MASTESIEFVGSAGSRLQGVLHQPDGPVVGSVLLAHCFTCSKDTQTTSRLAKALTRAGYVAFRFDFTGLGQSGGEFSETTVSSNVGDLSRAAVTLIERNAGPCVLVGHSLGGAAALLAARRLKTVTAVAVVGAPASVEHVTHLFGDARAEIETVGSAEVCIGGRPFRVGRSFLDDLANHDVIDAAANLARPLLVVVPGADAVVPPSEGRRIYDAAAEPKQLVEVAGADHLLTNRDHADELARTLVEWLDTTRDGSSPG
ncbi:MAG: alpha/beta hydrolase [Acidimicrobiales bacterium]|nr:alpha/beta hydrolase [Acidimicrobiales bacterium]